MTQRREDIAKLYSRAHVEETRYRDFSASRKQVRGQFRRGILGAPTSSSSDPDQEPIEGAAEPRPDVTLAPRWYALHSILKPARIETAIEATASGEHVPPSLMVVSVAGGVGKTCLVATLGRALAALGERVMLADTAECGLLPFYYGSRTYSPGVMRTFSPPAPSSAPTDTPVQILNLHTSHPREAGEDHLLEDLLRDGRSAGRILIDVATGRRDLVNRLLGLGSCALIPLLPDMSSVASLPLLQSVLAEGMPAFYLLNQFDETVPLHVDVRTLLEEELGDRLLPFVLRRSFAVSEALAEGMTILDYAPQSEVAEDYRSVARWLRTLSAPALRIQASARWSER
jgi:cellulose synthase operon protein YhjQ